MGNERLKAPTDVDESDVLDPENNSVYEKPGIEWEEAFEPVVAATSCAFVPGECFVRPQFP